MHHSNAEWFWNSATINHLALPAAPNALSMHGALAFSSNTLAMTDAGICVGMSNVNLNHESNRFVSNIPPHCKYSIPRPLIPSNWYAQYVRSGETYGKYHDTPVLVSNELNALVVNEYSSANMRDEILKFRHSQRTHYVNSNEYSTCPEQNDLSLTTTTTTNSLTTIREEVTNSSIAPPKKKWIRHYMMGEYEVFLLVLLQEQFSCPLDFICQGKLWGHRKFYCQM